ncbi:MAG TPA: hypothetical protein VM286_01750 [Candidatus Thermoplasmatota archaeon]|nr:hypothetical protein [Candidatus Thermoplasmatota archaeon]
MRPETAAPHPPEPGADEHRPFLQRLRRAGHDPSGFHPRHTSFWLVAGILLLAIAILLPFAAPGLAPLSQRTATLASLVFLVATPGLVMGMGRRAILVATVFVALLYGLTAWGGLALHLEDLFVAAVVMSFAIFALAGFNLVFVLEEMVYDAHRLLHLSRRAWLAVPTLLALALALLIPGWERASGLRFPALWVSSVLVSMVMLGWWATRAVSPVHNNATVVREMHLLILGALGACALADAIQYLQHASGLVPSLAAYLALLGTWVYVSYTTLQRTHFLLRGRNALPWVSILLSASFAIVAHAQTLFLAEGSDAVEDLVGQRVTYMVIGVWTGIGFYAARGVWRLLSGVARVREGAVRTVAKEGARVASSVAATERLVEAATYRIYKGLDRVIPGAQQPPEPIRRTGWEPDAGLLEFEEVRRRP